ncbi:unnamed protein product [Cunninghamella blakesleeana]
MLFKQVKLAKSFRWYKVDTITAVLQNLRNIIIDTPGKISIHYKCPIEPTQCLFDKDRRFPNDGIYICDGIGDLMGKLDVLSLTYSLISYPNRLERQYWDIESQGEAEIFLLSQINQFLNLIEQSKDTFDRQYFEQYYVLEWSEQDSHVDTSSSTTSSSLSMNPDPTTITTHTSTQPILTSQPLSTTSSSNYFSNLAPNPSVIFPDKSINPLIPQHQYSPNHMGNPNHQDKHKDIKTTVV